MHMCRSRIGDDNIIAAQLSIHGRLLLQVIYSAKQDIAGYKRFRLIVLKQEGLAEPAK